MEETRRVEDIIKKPLKEYKMPLIKRVAYYRPFIWFAFATILTALIVAPTIAANYENLLYYFLIAPVAILFIFALVNYIRFLHYAERKNAKIRFAVKNRQSFSIYSGGLGTGKSCDAMFISHEVGIENWHEVEYKMWKLISKLKDPKYKPTSDDKEVIDAYEFNINGDGVPEWGTNTPAYSEVYRRFSYDISANILKQIDRAPYKLAGVFDELGTTATMEMKDQRRSNEGGAADVTDFFKFDRHYIEGDLIGCEQDPNNIYKDARRVVGEIRVFTGKEVYLKPLFLTWLFEKLKKRFVRRMKVRDSLIFSKFMNFLEKYIGYCGYLKFSYKVKSNTETGATSVAFDTGEKDCVYVPCANPVIYRSRAFREGYKAKDKPIELKAWTSLYMTDERARSMMKSENLPKKKEESSKKSTSSDPLSF